MFDFHASPVVFVVDDDVSVRESLAPLIRSAGWQPQVFASAEEFLARPRACGPSCLVLDVNLPRLTGLDLQRLVAADQTTMPIIFMTAYGTVAMSVEAMKLGASEFLTKPLCTDELLRAIRKATGRSQELLDEANEIRRLRDRYASLTPREREVMGLVTSGRLNKQVGLELGISEATVKVHRGKVMQKMKADSLAALVAIAARL